MRYHNIQGIRLARVLALEAIYRWDLLDDDPEKALEDAIAREKPPEKIQELARKIVKSVVDNRDFIDGLISEFSINWPLKRMPIIDRSILRIAIGEMIANPDVGKNVVIDEAVELAKTYSTDEARAFINGLLDRIADKLIDEEK